MGAALKAYNPSATGEQQLEQQEAIIKEAERQLQDAEAAAYEAWYREACALQVIKVKKLFKHAGFAGWEDYCRSDRLPVMERHARRLLAAIPYREKLPEISGPIGSGWTERLVRPLIKLSTPSVAATVATRAIRHCEKTEERLTAKLMAEFVKEAMNTKKEQAAQRRKHDEQLRQATPAKALKTLLLYTRKHTGLLQSQGSKFWSDAEAESPGIVVRTAEAVEELASLLRE